MRNNLNWRELNEALPLLTEEQVKEMLEVEKAGPRRPTSLLRLHQRYTTLRTAREREELKRLTEEQS
jgi:hypothetical protein